MLKNIEDFKKSKSPDGKIEIYFHDESHCYFTPSLNEESVTYQSGTTFVGTFFPKFDEEGTAKRIAARTGRSAAVILAEWANKRDTASHLGTRVHEVAEDVLLGRPPRHKPENEREKLMMRHVWQHATNAKKNMKIVGVEMIVFNIDSFIAGTVDLLAFDKNGTAWILDWKTNKEIATGNRFNKFGLHPVSHMHDTNLSKYTLQLSLYQYLIQKSKYLPKVKNFKRALFHVTEQGIKTIPVPDCTTEIRDMIIHRLESVPF